MGRLTNIEPQEVLAAYEKLGAVPKRRCFVDVAEDGRACCCALGALYLAATNNLSTGEPLLIDQDEVDELNSGAADWANMMYDPAFVTWFTGAFDGAVTDAMVERVLGLDRAAVENGRDVAAAVFSDQQGAKS